VELAGVEHVGRDGVTAPVYTKENNLVRPPADAVSCRDLSASDRSTNGSMRSPQAGRVKVARIMLRFFGCRVVPDEERTESGCGDKENRCRGRSLHAAIQTPILNRLGDVRRFDTF
jgi:hypothetical protein